MTTPGSLLVAPGARTSRLTCGLQSREREAHWGTGANTSPCLLYSVKLLWKEEGGDEQKVNYMSKYGLFSALFCVQLIYFYCKNTINWVNSSRLCVLVSVTVPLL